MRRALPLAIAAIAAAAPAAAAQSVFASQGLGVPVAPLDGRARALGGIGVGLLGRNASLVNPAELIGFAFRGAAVALQGTDRSIDFEDASADAGASRFPLLRVIYPVGSRLVASVGYGSFLDQSWGVASEDIAVIGGEAITLRDQIESDGAIAQLQAGFGYAVSPSLSLGLVGGLYTGHVERVTTREFPADSTRPGLRTFRSTASWTQRAPFATAGFRWDPISALRVAGAVTWAGQLDGDVDEGSARDFDVDLPWQAAGGISALLAPRVMAVVAGRWAGWGTADDAFDAPSAPDDTWDFGAGLELGGDPRASTGFPIRLGYHRSRFPFRFNGDTPTEWAASLGLGANFAVTEAGALASIDAALERGSREAAGLTEDFWRFTLSLSVFGQ